MPNSKEDSQEIHLATLYSNIEDFKNSIINRIVNFILKRALNKIEKDHLEEIQERLNLIEVNQQAYFMAHDFPEDKQLTQQELSERDLRVHKDTIKYTRVKVSGLLADIRNEDRYQKLSRKYPDLFKEIRLILMKMETQLNKYSVAVERQEKEKKPTEIILAGSTKPYIFARALGGRYRAFSQGKEPLTTESTEGNCYGYVEQWAEKIAEAKQRQFISRVDRATKQQQDNQRSAFKNNVFSKNHIDMEELTQIIQLIKPGLVYGISIYNKENGHRLGLRRIPEKNEIEFFDPNIGIFVFKNDQDFVKWLTLHFESYYPSFTDIRLQEVGAQSKDSLASIPDIIEEKTEKSLYFPAALEKESTELNEYFLSECYKTLAVIGLNVRSGRFIMERQNAILAEIIPEQIVAYQKMIAFKLGDVSAQNAVGHEQIIDNITLKEPVLKLIEERIRKISNVKDSARLVLQELQHEIKNNPDSVPLEALLNHFLSKKNSKGETYFKILHASSDHRRLMKGLQAHYEISPACILLLQQKLLLTLTDLSLSHGNEPVYKDVLLPTIKRYAEGKSSVNQTLSTMVNALKRPKVVSLNLFNKSSEDEAVKIINKINLNDPHSLKTAQEKISVILKKQQEAKSTLGSHHRAASRF